MASEIIEVRGHIIDSLTLTKILDRIVSSGASFNAVEFRIGQKRADQSFARIEITAESGEALNTLLLELREHGAEIVSQK